MSIFLSKTSEEKYVHNFIREILPEEIMTIAGKTMQFSSLIFLLQLGSTLYMVGLIWFVQLVHYPLHGSVGPDHFVLYQQRHMQWTSFAVGPAMLIEAATTLVLYLAPSSHFPSWAPTFGLVLLLLVWGSTAVLQVPFHNQLLSEFNPDAHQSLVWSNWIRTIGWSARGILILWLTSLLLKV